MTTELPQKTVDSAKKRGPGPLGVAAVAGVAAMVVLVYHQTFITLWRTWETSPNYSHGYLIPPVVAFLLWRDRRRYLAARGRGSLFGLVLVGLALLGHIVSIRAGIFMTQG